MTMAKRIEKLEGVAGREGECPVIFKIVTDGEDEPRSPTDAEVEAAIAARPRPVAILVWDGDKFLDRWGES